MSLEGKDIVNAAKKQPFVFACATLAAILLAFTYWRSGAIPELQSRLDERSLVLQKNKTNVTYSVQLDAHLKALADINGKIKANALRFEDLAQSQRMFYGLEADTGVKLIDLRQQPPDKALPPNSAQLTYVPVVFSLAVEGEYRQILMFSKRIESGGTLSRVSRAVFSIGAKNVPSLDMTVEMLGLKQ